MFRLPTFKKQVVFFTIGSLIETADEAIGDARLGDNGTNLENYFSPQVQAASRAPGIAAREPIALFYLSVP